MRCTVICFALLAGCPTTPSADAGTERDTPADDAPTADAPELDATRTDAPADAPSALDAPTPADVPDAFVSCGPRTVDAPTTPACVTTTFDCILRAASPDDQAACVAADPMGAVCGACLEQDLQHQCTTRGYCNAEVGALACCLEVACPSADAGCVAAARAAAGACNTVSQELIRCTNAEVGMRHCGITGVCAIR